MRIVHVSPSYAPLVGGAERLLQAVSERLVARGHDVTILTFDCRTLRDFSSALGAGLPPREMLNGVRIIRVKPVHGRLNRLHQWWLRQRGGWRTTQWIVGEDLWPLGLPSGIGTVLPLARLPADVVTSFNWHFGVSYWTCLPRPLQRAPRVAIPILHIAREWAQKEIYARMLGDCDAAIVCTAAEGEFVRAKGGTRVVVAGAGVEQKRFEQRDGARIRALHGIGTRPVVGFVGRQDTNKGVPTLIRAMHTVWRQVPDAVLLMAGQRAHRDPTVAGMIDSFSATDRQNVVLIDDFADEDGPSIMDACDLLALPSVEESFGLVMVEAWMCGKPVIGADIASTRCIIDHGVDGFVVKPFNSDDLAARILELLADPATRELFGRRGREKTLERYTWDRVTDAWEETFREVLALPAARRADDIPDHERDRNGVPVPARSLTSRNGP
jgi:glycosyltransferase involved in cell wall biosynthesis